MRVLLLHNRYRAAGGEERAVAETAALLAARGDAVEVLERTSAGLSRARAGRALLRGGADPDGVALAVRRFRPDVVHAHNLHPLLGHRALQAARREGAAVVVHLHNYRLSCSIGTAWREGRPCSRCHGRDTRSAVRFACRGSRAESAAYAAALASHRGALEAAADRFAAPSAAARDRLVALGAPPRRTDVVPNSLGPEEFASSSSAGDGTYALYVGRLAPEKGVDVAIAAARRAGVALHVVGDGPARPALAAAAASGDVTFAGPLGPDGVAAERRGAALALVPSRWEEPFGYAALEAMAAGLPALVSDRGGLPALLPPGEAALPDGDVAAWATAIRALWEDPAGRAARGREATAHVRAHYGHGAVATALDRVYAAALAARDERAERA